MKAIFWGATGQAKVLREALGESLQLLALFDRRELPSPFDGVPLFVGDAGLDAWLRDCTDVSAISAVVAIGGARGRDRLQRMAQLRGRGFGLAEAVHPRAFVATDARRGDACQILALAAVCSHAQLGHGVIVNTKASVDHDCVIGDGAHIGPGAVLAGEVQVGDCAFVGAGAVVLPGRRIGTGAIVGAGAIVTRDVPPGAIVVGNPARPLSQS